LECGGLTPLFDFCGSEKSPTKSGVKPPHSKFFQLTKSQLQSRCMATASGRCGSSADLRERRAPCIRLRFADNAEDKVKKCQGRRKNLGWFLQNPERVATGYYRRLLIGVPSAFRRRPRNLWNRRVRRATLHRLVPLPLELRTRLPLGIFVALRDAITNHCQQLGIVDRACQIPVRFYLI
jgi:hypothetical protein